MNISRKILFFVLSLCIFVHCQNSSKKPEQTIPPSTEESKSILPDDQSGHLKNTELWKKFDGLVDEQKFTEASEVVKSILQKSQTVHDNDEWLKAMVRTTDLQVALHGYETAVKFIREQPWPEGPTQQTILHLFYARTLEFYANRYSWEIRNREKIDSKNQDDLETWTWDQLSTEIQKTYEKIWAKREGLGSLPVDQFSDFIEANSYPREIRSSLRDTLSYMTASYLANTGTWRPEHTNEIFVLDLESLLGSRPVGKVTAIDDTTVHPLIKTTNILKDLESWHMARGEHAAALEAYLERVRHLRTHFAQHDEALLIESSLEKRLNQARHLSWWASGMATWARMVQLDPSPGALKRAHDLASQGYKAYPEAVGGKQCYEILKNIELPGYDLVGMASDGPDKQSIGLHYKNLTKLYFRAYHVDLAKRIESTRYEIFLNSLELEEFIKKSKPDYAWVADLLMTTDFQQHKKFIVPPMKEKGAYVVLSSAKADFSEADNQIRGLHMILGDLVLLTSQNNGDEVEATVLSGATGEPVADAQVLLYKTDWNRGHRVVQSKITGRDGTVGFRAPGDGDHFVFAKKAGDIALDSQYMYFYKNQVPSAKKATLIYTDRSIYRPLQKIYWKAIAFGGNIAASDYHTLPQTSLEISLIDPNSQTVETKTVKTNPFGTASGEFVIPAGRLLGSWRIASSDEGSSIIHVEEYKRPTFEVKFLEANSALRLNKAATLEGEARYYFGLPVTDGNVTWRVARKPLYPWWWQSESPVTESVVAQVVATGTSPLDQEGKFSLTFTPKADPHQSGDIIYQYAVSADITDTGGETRSAERFYHIGMQAVKAVAKMNTNFFLENSPSQLTLIRSNLDDVPMPGKGSWRVVALKQPVKTLLPAEQPLDQQKKSASKSDFSDDVRSRWDPQYNPQLLLRQWSDGAEKTSGQVEHNDKGEGLVALPALPAGAYRLYYDTKDAFGAPYQLTHEFIVAGPNIRLALPGFFLVEKNKVTAGGMARVLVVSDFPNQTIIFDTWRAGRRVDRRFLVSGKDPRLIEIPVAQSDRGGFAVSMQVVRDHQLINFAESLYVPWDNKELSLEFSTFRDKIRPGEKEKWRVKVKSAAENTSAQFVAEILAYMYDRSLDLFTQHNPPNPIAIFPNFDFWAGVRASLGTAPSAWMNSNGFKEVDIGDPLASDRLKFLSGYGIGGPGAGKDDFGGGDVPLTMSADVAPEQREISPKKIAEEAKPHDDNKTKEQGVASEKTVELRSDFSETAFWYPHLITDQDGSVLLEFTVPDSVTSWNVWVHAITNDLQSASKLVLTESVKELMVRPYLPRFLREGDEATLKVVVNNASDHELAGDLTFDVIDPETEQSLLDEFGLKRGDAAQKFLAPSGGSSNLSFAIKTPSRVGPVAFKVIAKTGSFSDGELRPLPVLPGRIHLAQSRFVTLQDKGQRVMEFADLAKNDDPTRIHEQLVVTLDAQLFYSVLSALPYLVNYPYECTEQLLNKFLSTGILSSLYKDYPAIAKMADQFSKRQTQLEVWNKPDPNRKIALEETPWLQEAAGGETENLSNVLDPRLVVAKKQEALLKIKKSQTSSGGFPWFPGGPPSPFMTLYLLHGFSKGLEFGVDVPQDMVKQAWSYLHNYYVDSVVKDMMSGDCCWEFVTFLNYTLSHYPDSSWMGGVFGSDDRQKMLDYSFKHWKDHSPYLKGYLALTLKRMNRGDDAKLVWASVMDSAKTAPDQGTFWAPEDRSWLWYNDTIETHAFAIRTLMEITPDDPRLEGLVQWLFLNKKLNHWKSTKATAEVIYALAHYLQKTGQLGLREAASVTVGDQQKTFVFEPEEYTGHKNQIVLAGSEIDPAADSKITVEKTTKGYVLASATWHFSTEKLPEVAEGDFLRVTRRYFKRVKNKNEITLEPLEEGAKLVPGDQLEVHLSLTSKHSVQYVHLRDPRAAGLEPENAVSQYRYDLGIGWYEETRDSSTNFFFESLPQGEYTFKYRVRANVAGIFKVAPATVQPMYAPEFTAYSAGSMVTINAL